MKPKGRIVALVCLLLSSLSSCGVMSRIMADTVILSKNKPLVQQLIQKNTVYIVRQDFDLRGAELSIPVGCTLIFEGGCIKNGSLKGNGTVVSLKQNKPILDEVMLSGTFTAKNFPLNAYSTDNLDYLYSFIQAFSGTELYLNDDYSVSKYIGLLDGTAPKDIIIDGRGHRLSLYSFGAHHIHNCIIKNITIEASHNITPQNKWKTDRFNFGVIGSFESSTLVFQNVTFTEETEFAYIRGFKSIDISECNEVGSYFFVYDCNNVYFHNNSIESASRGYYSIGRMTDEGKVKIENNTLRNISGGGVILTGGLKYNVSIISNVLENVGGGGAELSCINIHPRGSISVKNNLIVANKGASSLDIDAARPEYYNEATTVIVKNNEINNVSGDTTLHGMALVGLAKLYFKNNKITNQRFSFWDTPYMEFIGNTITIKTALDREAEIGSMSTHETTDNTNYIHIYKKNVYNLSSASGSAHIKYLSKAPVRLIGRGNKYSCPVVFVDKYNKFDASGDIKIYK